MASPAPGRPLNRGWRSRAASCWPAWPGTRAMRTGSSPKSKPAGFCPARPIRRSRRRPRSCWPWRPYWRADLFATLGQLDAAETEVGLCWAAGRSGAVQVVEVAGPLAEARLAAARGDTAAADGALRRAADGGRRVGSVMYVPAALAHL